MKDILCCISNLEEWADGYLLGTTHILGVPHHCQFIKVKTNRPGVQVCAGRSAEAQGNFDTACSMMDSAFQTVTLPQPFEGEWICVIHPYGE